MKKVCSLLILLGLLASPALGAELLAPGDAIITVDADGLVSRSRIPGDGEAPHQILDGNLGTKYLNFGDHGYNTGFIVTPSGGSSVIQSFQLGTGGDADGRDPAQWEIWGTNDAITSANHSIGRAENWTLISSGTDAGLNANPGRGVYGSVVDFANSTAYTSYRMTFPTIRDNSSTMQVSEVDFWTGAAATGTDVLTVGSFMLAIQETPDSSHPGAEGPEKLIDGVTNTKLLNFGKENTGFIVTPSGTAAVKGFQITTANDYAGRDPASWVLYGTNDAIASVDNSDGLGESWVEIDSGLLALTDDRHALSGILGVDNDTAYASYKMLFPTMKDVNGDRIDSMQIDEIQFYDVPEPATMLLLGLGGLLLRRRK